MQSSSLFKAGALCAGNADMRDRMAIALTKAQLLGYNIPDNAGSREKAHALRWRWASEFMQAWRDYEDPVDGEGNPVPGEGVGVLAVSDTDIINWVKSEYELV